MLIFRVSNVSELGFAIVTIATNCAILAITISMSGMIAERTHRWVP